MTQVWLANSILDYIRTSLILFPLSLFLFRDNQHFQLAFNCASCEANWAVGAAADAQWKHNKCSKPSPSGRLAHSAHSRGTGNCGAANRQPVALDCLNSTICSSRRSSRVHSVVGFSVCRSACGALAVKYECCSIRSSVCVCVFACERCVNSRVGAQSHMQTEREEPGSRASRYLCMNLGK